MSLQVLHMEIVRKLPTRLALEQLPIVQETSLASIGTGLLVGWGLFRALVMASVRLGVSSNVSPILTANE